MKLSRPVAATLAGAMVLIGCQASTSTPATPSVATPSDSPTTTSTSSASIEPSPPAPASPTHSLPPVTSWSMTASFDSDPGTAYVTDIAAWSGGFVAIGSAWGSANLVNPEMPAVWTSVDGESWDAQAVERLAGRGELGDLRPTRRG